MATVERVCRTRSATAPPPAGAPMPLGHLRVADVSCGRESCAAPARPLLERVPRTPAAGPGRCARFDEPITCATTRRISLAPINSRSETILQVPVSAHRHHRPIRIAQMPRSLCATMISPSEHSPTAAYARRFAPPARKLRWAPADMGRSFGVEARAGVVAGIVDGNPVTLAACSTRCARADGVSHFAYCFGVTPADRLEPRVGNETGSCPLPVAKSPKRMCRPPSVSMARQAA